MAKWIEFRQVFAVSHKTLTNKWEVVTKQGGHLGYVKWYSGWRRYCFFPSPGTLYEQDCLRDIAEFCQTESKRYKESA